MQIPGISANDQISGIASEGGLGAKDLDRGAFLDLFVSQLKNQDPLDPIQNEDFVEQLATFSSLEQLETMNENMIASIALNQSNALLSQLTGSSALIGKTVSWTNPDTGLESKGTVDAVKIDQGLAVLRIGGRDVPLATVNEILADAIEDSTSESDAESVDDTLETNADNA